MFTGWVGVAIVAVSLIIAAIMNWDKIMKYAKAGMQVASNVVQNISTGMKAAILGVTDKCPWLITAFEMLKGLMSGLRDAAMALAAGLGQLMGAIGGFLANIGNSIMNYRDGALGKGLTATWNNIANLANAPRNSDVNARFDKTFGGRTIVVNNHNTVSPTINISKTDGDPRKHAKIVMDMIDDAQRKAGASHSLAGGNHISYAHSGAH
ncbi:MAG TPA: hypothetical protein V6C76_11770 [Drouetiella sp.]